MSRRLMLVLPVLFAACNDHPTTPGHPTPASLTLVSGGGQQGATGEFLPEPLVVQVADAGGRAVPGTIVTWSVPAGEGYLGFLPGDIQPASSVQSRADTQGKARIYFRPNVPGTTHVATAFAGLPPVVTTVVSTGLAVQVISFGPYYCAGGNDHSFFSGGGDIPAGTGVVWAFSRYLPAGCLGRIVARTVPQGGEAVQGEALTPGQRFALRLDTPGTWVFEDARNGGQVTLRVVPVPAPGAPAVGSPRVEGPQSGS